MSTDFLKFHLKKHKMFIFVDFWNIKPYNTILGV